MSTSFTILLVDDETDMMREVRSVLARHLVVEGGDRSVIFVEACHGADALSKVRGLEGRVDLIVSDHQMPVMNGREFAEALRLSYPSLFRRLVIATASVVPHDYFLRHEVPVASKFALATQLVNQVDLMLMRDVV